MKEYTNEHISALLFKKIIGSISSSEELELDSWRQEDSKNEQLYLRMLDHQHIEELLRQRQMVPIDRLLADMTERLQLEVSSHTSHSWRRWAVAASFLLLVSVSTYWFWTQKEQKEK